MDWQQNYDALKEYNEKHGTWVVDPNVPGDYDRRGRQRLGDLANFVSFNQCHLHHLSKERRHLWFLLTGQETDKPRPRRKEPAKPRWNPKMNKSSSASNNSNKQKTAPEPTINTRHIVNGQEFNHRPSSQDLYSRYRAKGIGLSQMQWNSMFDKLVAFRRVHGHVNVPVRFKIDPKLGKWVSRQREARTTMIPERRDRLNAIGFSWTQQQKSKPTLDINKNRRTFDVLWNSRLEQLQVFRTVFGHSLVETTPNPQILFMDDAEECDKLRRWVHKQRALGGRGELRPERNEQLQSLGFWKDRHLDGTQASSRAKEVSPLEQELEEYEELDPPIDETGLAAPVSREAVEEHVKFFEIETNKKEAIQKIEFRAVPPVGNRLPPLEIPAHVKRQQTMEYFRHIKKQKNEDKEERERRNSQLVIQEALKQQQEDLRRMLKQPDMELGNEEGVLSEDEEKYMDDDEEEEEEEEEVNSDDEEAKAIAQTVAEQVLLEAIEASEFDQRKKEEEAAQREAEYARKRAEAARKRKEKDNAIKEAGERDAAKRQAPAVPPVAPPNSPPQPKKKKTRVRRPKPVVTPPVPAIAQPPTKPASAATKPVPEGPVYHSPIPSKKIEYFLVEKEIQSFDDAFVKMLDAKTPDWKRKRRWSYVCM
ncbi:helicase [Seminavis robusta]|uniref:Helicase n=1 Tax=Seminavis robusta TaxID=568900 RepID=A0A9N8E9Z3_9STRA|nr:helicase [Seminavis robusta]|eukprot:Sro819_g207130.1 helicase (648) ;mRNA; f:30766-32709